MIDAMRIHTSYLLANLGLALKSNLKWKQNTSNDQRVMKYKPFLVLRSEVDKMTISGILRLFDYFELRNANDTKHGGATIFETHFTYILWNATMRRFTLYGGTIFGRRT